MKAMWTGDWSANIQLSDGEYLQYLVITQANKLFPDQRLEAVNYYHKALHLGCCSSPRSASADAEILSAKASFKKINEIICYQDYLLSIKTFYDFLCFSLKRMWNYFSFITYLQLSFFKLWYRQLSLKLLFRDILKMNSHKRLQMWQHQLSQTQEATSKIPAPKHCTFNSLNW